MFLTVQMFSCLCYTFEINVFCFVWSKWTKNRAYFLERYQNLTGVKSLVLLHWANRKQLYKDMLLTLIIKPPNLWMQNGKINSNLQKLRYIYQDLLNNFSVDLTMWVICPSKPRNRKWGGKFVFFTPKISNLDFV